LVPVTGTMKKSADGEICDKDWTVRVFDGLELDLEEPDTYIPLMGFITYVLLCGFVSGMQDQFNPDVLSATVTYAVIVLTLEVTAAKAVLYMAGAVNAPVIDLAALLGYKFAHLSLQLIVGIILGVGWKPSGFLFQLLSLGFMVSCGASLWQALLRLTRMHPAKGNDIAIEMHKVVSKVLPASQLVLCWLLMPAWPQRIEAVAPDTIAAVASEMISAATNVSAP